MKLKKLLEVLNPGDGIYVRTVGDSYSMSGTVESCLMDTKIPEIPDLLKAKVVEVSAFVEGNFSITVHLKGDKYD
jgi:hypothetical protein